MHKRTKCCTQVLLPVVRILLIVLLATSCHLFRRHNADDGGTPSQNSAGSAPQHNQSVQARQQAANIAQAMGDSPDINNKDILAKYKQEATAIVQALVDKSSADKDRQLTRLQQVAHSISTEEKAAEILRMAESKWYSVTDDCEVKQNIIHICIIFVQYSIQRLSFLNFLVNVVSIPHHNFSSAVIEALTELYDSNNNVLQTLDEDQKNIVESLILIQKLTKAPMENDKFNQQLALLRAVAAHLTSQAMEPVFSMVASLHAAKAFFPTPRRRLIYICKIFVKCREGHSGFFRILTDLAFVENHQNVSDAVRAVVDNFDGQNDQRLFDVYSKDIISELLNRNLLHNHPKYKLELLKGMAPAISNQGVKSILTLLGDTSNKSESKILNILHICKIFAQSKTPKLEFLKILANLALTQDNQNVFSTAITALTELYDLDNNVLQALDEDQSKIVKSLIIFKKLIDTSPTSEDSSQHTECGQQLMPLKELVPSLTPDDIEQILSKLSKLLRGLHGLSHAISIREIYQIFATNDNDAIKKKFLQTLKDFCSKHEHQTLCSIAARDLIPLMLTDEQVCLACECFLSKGLPIVCNEGVKALRQLSSNGTVHTKLSRMLSQASKNQYYNSQYVIRIAVVSILQDWHASLESQCFSKILLQAIQDAHWGVREQAASVFEVSMNPATAIELAYSLSALLDVNSNNRKNLVNVDIVKALINLSKVLLQGIINTQNEDVHNAALAFKKLSASLCRAIKDQNHDSKLRQQAVWAPPKLLESLLETIKNQDETVRQKVTSAFEELLESLLETIKNQDKAVLQAATSALCNLSIKLCKAIKDQKHDSKVLQAAKSALQKLATSLLKTIENQDEHGRIEAIQILTQLVADIDIESFSEIFPQENQLLNTFLQDSAKTNQQIYNAGSNLLAKLSAKDQKFLLYFLEFTNNLSSSVSFLRSTESRSFQKVLTVLESIQPIDSASVAILLQAQQHREKSLQEIAKKKIDERVNNPDASFIENLFAIVKDECQISNIRVLAVREFIRILHKPNHPNSSINRSTWLSDFVQVIKDNNAQVRQAVVQAFGEFQNIDQNALAELLKAITNTDDQVRQAVVQVLGKLQYVKGYPAQSQQAIVETLCSVVNTDQKGEVCLEAVNALGEAQQGGEILGIVLGYIEIRNGEVHNYYPQIAAALQAALRRTEDGVCQAAAQVLKQFYVIEKGILPFTTNSPAATYTQTIVEKIFGDASFFLKFETLHSSLEALEELTKGQQSKYFSSVTCTYNYLKTIQNRLSQFLSNVIVQESKNDNRLLKALQALSSCNVTDSQYLVGLSAIIEHNTNSAVYQAAVQVLSAFYSKEAQRSQANQNTVVISIEALSRLNTKIEHIDTFLRALENDTNNENEQGSNQKIEAQKYLKATKERLLTLMYAAAKDQRVQTRAEAVEALVALYTSQSKLFSKVLEKYPKDTSGSNAATQAFKELESTIKEIVTALCTVATTDKAKRVYLQAFQALVTLYTSQKECLEILSHHASDNQNCDTVRNVCQQLGNDLNEKIVTALCQVIIDKGSEVPGKAFQALVILYTSQSQAFLEVFTQDSNSRKYNFDAICTTLNSRLFKKLKTIYRFAKALNKASKQYKSQPNPIKYANKIKKIYGAILEHLENIVYVQEEGRIGVSRQAIEALKDLGGIDILHKICKKNSLSLEVRLEAIKGLEQFYAIDQQQLASEQRETVAAVLQQLALKGLKTIDSSLKVLQQITEDQTKGQEATSQDQSVQNATQESQKEGQSVSEAAQDGQRLQQAAKQACEKLTATKRNLVQGLNDVLNHQDGDSKNRLEAFLILAEFEPIGYEVLAMVCEILQKDLSMESKVSSIFKNLNLKYVKSDIQVFKTLLERLKDSTFWAFQEVMGFLQQLYTKEFRGWQSMFDEHSTDNNDPEIVTQILKHPSFDQLKTIGRCLRILQHNSDGYRQALATNSISALKPIYQKIVAFLKKMIATANASNAANAETWNPCCRSAIQALRELGDIRLLHEAIRNKNNKVRQAAVQALGEFYAIDEALSKLLGEYTQAANATIIPSILDELAVKGLETIGDSLALLENAISDVDTRVQAEAQQALNATKQKSLEFLRNVVSSNQDNSLCEKAIKVLGKFGAAIDGQSVTVVYKTAVDRVTIPTNFNLTDQQNKKISLCTTAVEALGNLGTAIGLEVLEKFLDIANKKNIAENQLVKDLCQAAVQALKQLSASINAESLPFWSKLPSNSRANQELRLAAIRALGKLGASIGSEALSLALAALQQAANGQDDSLKEAAEEALIEFEASHPKACSDIAQGFTLQHASSSQLGQGQHQAQGL